MVKPVQGLTTKKDKELFEKLQEYKATLTEEKRQAIVDQTSALLAYQEEPSSEAALRTIPLLNREDMKKEAAAYINEVHMKENTTILF